jgi:hypothetical protein
MRTDLDPSTWGGPIAAQVKSLNDAQHLFGLATKAGNPDEVNNLTDVQMLELATGFARMLKGGVPGEAEAAHLVPPENLQAGIAGIQQWFKNKPMGRNQQEFVKTFAHSIKRQRDISQRIVDETKAQRSGGHSELKKLAPDLWRRGILNAHMDPALFDTEGVYQLPAQDSVAKGGLTEEKKKRLEELRRKMAEQKKGAQ